MSTHGAILFRTYYLWPWNIKCLADGWPINVFSVRFIHVTPNACFWRRHSTLKFTYVVVFGVRRPSEDDIAVGTRVRAHISWSVAVRKSREGFSGRTDIFLVVGDVTWLVQTVRFVAFGTREKIPRPSLRAYPPVTDCNTDWNRVSTKMSVIILVAHCLARRAGKSIEPIKAVPVTGIRREFNFYVHSWRAIYCRIEIKTKIPAFQTPRANSDCFSCVRIFSAFPWCACKLSYNTWYLLYHFDSSLGKYTQFGILSSSRHEKRTRFRTISR